MKSAKEMAILSWSGGKDSALVLCELQEARGYEIVALLTTITSVAGSERKGWDVRYRISR